MAAAITLAEKRETEIPGIFQYIMNEMLAANNIPKVKFPLSVVSGYKDNRTDNWRPKRQKENALIH